MTVQAFAPSDWELFVGDGPTLTEALDSEKWVSMDTLDVPRHLRNRP